MMEFNTNFWVITLDFVGKILLAIVALMVHYKVQTEKRIDGKVVKEIKTELVLGVISIILFILSYILSFRLN